MLRGKEKVDEQRKVVGATRKELFMVTFASLHFISHCVVSIAAFTRDAGNTLFG
jgi:hypothetical protein